MMAGVMMIGDMLDGLSSALIWGTSLACIHYRFCILESLLRPYVAVPTCFSHSILSPLYNKLLTNQFHSHST